MKTRMLFASLAWLTIAGSALAQVDEPASPADVKPGPAGDPTGDAVPTIDRVQEPAILETVPALGGQTDIVNRPDANPDANTDPDAAGTPAATPADQTAPMPNAITNDAEQQPTANRAADDKSWRYRWHNGRWWYWMPNRSWVIWDGNQWLNQADFNAQYQARYTGPRFRGYSQPYYNDGRYSTGYRGNYQPYYNGYRGNYYGPGYNNNNYYGPGYGNQSGYGPGNRYYSPYSDGSPRGNAGASVGGAIGGAIGGNQGGNVGAAIGGALGSQPR